MAHKVGDTVTVTRGPHKGDAHKVIHVHKDGRVNVKPHNKMPHQIKYRHGAATAKSHEVRKMNELSIADVQKATAKAKKRQEKERKTTGKSGVSVTDLSARLPKKESTIKSFTEIARSMTPMRDKFGKSKAEKEAEKKKESEKDEGYVSHAQRKAVWANKADGGKGHPDKKEGTIITPKDFKMKDDDKNKLKKIADLMKKAKATKEACWDTHKQVGMKKKGGKMVPNCVPKNENQKAALMKKLAKSAQSSEKGKKAVTLAKAPFKIPSKNEGAMKRIATSQSSKADRMAPGKGLDTFKKKPPEKKEVLDTDKARKSYMDKARYSKDRATNSAVANIMRKTDHSKDLKTRANRVKGMDRVRNKAIMKFREM